ncbi:hypothetical protein [Pseudoduganella namucuonensis]|uniref:Uncharacterized protein n=1 Tax=Pseudoduganella namucuonensis TaxID=1035707 RepID=A0A1I7I565_9BURK|nr:hypothetical protein [Pseudoduganella namucuonensis]SFU68100.1 hypothetical protein SAMN05216552_1007104 [Pseudoduganella namucuonensis]
MTSDDLIADAAAQSYLPQSWDVTATEPKFYWYDLITDFPPVPDFRDPLGRYLRRMQFAIEATLDKRLLYLLVSRPRLRFDLKRGTSWGFFSLKLTVPLLVGPNQDRESVTIDLKVPDDATLKKPTVQMFDKFITLNWGSLIETYTAHDLLQAFDIKMSFPSRVHYVGQTHDPAGRLLKGRLSSVNRICDRNQPDYDNFLLVQRLNINTFGAKHPSDDGSEQAQEQLLKERMDAIECVLIQYFEDETRKTRSPREQLARQTRLRNLQNSHRLVGMRVDLGMEVSSSFQRLYSDKVGESDHHVFECTLQEGQATFRKPAKA